jgi:hypothetical protein
LHLGELMLGLSLTVFQAMEVCVELKIKLTGGWTTSIFPAVERWLNEDGDRWKALKHLDPKGSMGRYRSVVDYLYASVIPTKRAEIFRFYVSGKTSDMAGSILTMNERNVMEAQMLIALEIAYQLWCEKRRSSWRQVRATVAELAA